MFHPTNPHLLASGDLSAEVRVWDISDEQNGYECWRHESSGLNTQSTQKISISLTFHPTDNVLLIAVQNELRIWDWKHRREPFAMIKTDSDREKVSFIRLCPLGTRLISAIQQTNNEVVNEEQLLPNPLDEATDIERRLLASSRAPLGTLGRLPTVNFPHPRNNDHPLRFNIRSNPYRFEHDLTALPPADDLRTPPPTLRRLVPPPETPVSTQARVDHFPISISSKLLNVLIKPICSLS